MNILILAMAIGSLFFYVVPMIRRAWVLRKHNVPDLPKRALPPCLPQAADGDGAYLRERARRRRYEAMGMADEYHPHKW